MSQLVEYSSSGAISGKGAGAKIGSATLTAAAANASAQILDGGNPILSLAAVIGTSVDKHLADGESGHTFAGATSITITGAGATLDIEWL